MTHRGRGERDPLAHQESQARGHLRLVTGRNENVGVVVPIRPEEERDPLLDDPAYQEWRRTLGPAIPPVTEEVRLPDVSGFDVAEDLSDLELREAWEADRADGIYDDLTTSERRGGHLGARDHRER